MRSRNRKRSRYRLVLGRTTRRDHGCRELEAAIGVARSLVGIVSPISYAGYDLALSRAHTDLLLGYVDRSLRTPGATRHESIPRISDWRNALRLRTRSPIKFTRIAYPRPSRNSKPIVRFLDHADRQIRRYIRVKKKLIALLNEQKQAIVRPSVTRGSTPTLRLERSLASNGSAMCRTIGGCLRQASVAKLIDVNQNGAVR